MLRSPLEVCRTERLATAASILALAVSLWMMFALIASFLQLQTAADEWFEQFVPAVYLEAGVDGPDVASIAAEVENWSKVSTVDVETPDDSLQRLRDHLGDDQVRQLGIDQAMMPTRLMVHPRLWRPGRIDVTSRVEALEVRDYVVAVDVPDADTLAWIERGRTVASGVGLAALLGFVAALIVLATTLRRYQHRERTENHLLEVFGASSMSLRSPTLWRGMYLGAAAGLIAALCFLAWSIALDGLVVDTVGQGAFPAVRAALWATAVMPAGVIVGAVVGWLCSRPGGDTPAQHQNDGLLEWKRESP